MIKRFTFFFLMFTFLCSFSLSAQQIWPGDVDNKGKVGVTDLLYLGVAFGAEGTPRDDISSQLSWSPSTMGTPWVQQFPDTTNYAYADVDGDGKVSEEDAKPILAFFGNHHTAPDHGMLRAPDTAANIPQLQLVPIAIRSQGDDNYLVLEVHLNQEGGRVEDLYGLAFQTRFTPGAVMPSEITTYRDTTGWFVSVGEQTLGVSGVDTAQHKFSLAVTRINHQNTRGNGKLFSLTLPVAQFITLDNLESIGLEVDSLVMVNRDLAAQPVGVQASSFVADSGCPLTVAPVCAANGVTYLNSCFAEAAGEMFYTAGACYNPGIDVAAMDSLAGCPQTYAPVCGFNFVTYANACVAANAGLVTYTSGQCGPNDFSCYDPSLIVISSATTVNTITGEIQINCPTSGQAVLGCNGIVFPNACTAEASGVRSYTTIGDDNDCIDFTEIDQDPDCAETVDYVCGCNDETFINACYAEAAGVQQYTPGPCGGNSGICAEAIPISCGDYLPNETTIGAGNQIVSYPGCTGSTMLGPDRVYVIQKTGAGDLQIGLEIMTPGLDLDIFLLRGDCNDFTCLDGSTTSNTITNNEGIILPDAPIGTYYIVVDQQNAGQGGNYRLEVSCGYLDCSDAQPLTCGTTYSGSNVNGNDDVSLYRCGNTLNVENNGPEIVHTFTTDEAGPVTIDLTGLSANLELFLLSSCDRGSCLQYSQNPGTNSEQIVRDLQPGTYYVVVDGYNGAISDYNLTVDCSQDCNLTYQPTGTTAAGCGQNNGVHNFSVYNGTATYIATYTGPVSGSAVSQSGHFCFVNLVPGTYSLTVQDAAGCTLTRNFTVGDGGNLGLHLNPNAASCGGEGSINATVTGSNPPYMVSITGQESANLTAPGNSFTINNLSAGTYTIVITDGSGCSASSTTTVEQGTGNLSVIATPYPAGCGEEGRINLDISNGYAPYTVRLQGPESGSAVVNANNFNVINLPAGAYSLTLTDAYGCTYQEFIVIPDGEMDVQVTTSPASCGNPGSALVSVNSGTPPYTINYFGPTSGSTVITGSSTVINGLASGSYTFSVWDDSGCDQTESAFVADEGGTMSVSIVAGSPDCNATTVPVFFNVTGGTPTYSVNYSGPVNGTFTINGSGQGVIPLPAGNYTFIITDFNGCSYAESLTVNGGANNLSFLAELAPNACGALENIVTNITGGSAPFSVSVTNNCGLEESVFQTFNTQFTLPNLANCTYQIDIEDANGCHSTQSITVNSQAQADLLVLTPVGGACQGIGYIDLEVIGGDDPYYISWTGPVNGNVALITPTYRVENLPAGVYTFSITTDDGCTDTESVTLNNGGNLDLISSLVTMDCGQYDQIWNDIIGGTPPFTVEVTRLCDEDMETMVIQTNGFELTDLIPCDYKIKVTDANGCMTMNTITVFPYDLFNPVANPGLCGQPGNIVIDIMNEAAMPPFTVSYTGPQSDNFVLNSTGATLSSLPAGQYTITITDAGGCSETEVVTLEDSPSDLDLQTAVIFNECGQYNQLWNDIDGGTPPFTVVVTRLCDNTVDTTFVTSENGFELSDLEECEYKVKVTDANGCMDMETRQVEPSDPDLFTATPISGPCGEAGRITVNFHGGTAPYDFTYLGPQSGNTTVNGTALNLNDLPPGFYTLIAVDQNGCEETETVTVELVESDLDLNSALILNNCGQYNQIWNDILGGTPPYNVTVTRLCDNTPYTNFVTSDDFFELFELPPCDYKIVIVDAAGCMTMETITVFPSPADIFELTSTDGNCDDLGSLTVNFIAGTPPYTLEYTGPVGDTVVLDSVPYTATNLPGGTYTVIVRDASGCVETMQTEIISLPSDLELTTSLILNDCGQYNQIWNDITGGTGPYWVTVTRLCDDTEYANFMSFEASFELFDLPPCEYKITITDANGCMTMDTITVFPSPTNLFELTPFNGECNELGGFTVNIVAGTPPYVLEYTGPLSGTINLDSMPYTVTDLPSGEYTVIVRDALDCVETMQTDINNTTTDLELVTAIIFNDCGQYNQLWNDVNGGVPPYTVEVTRLCDNTQDTTFTTSEQFFELFNLDPCTYKVKVTDAAGCMVMGTSTINSTSADLVDLTLNTECGSPSILIDFTQGTAPFNVMLMANGDERSFDNVSGPQLLVENVVDGDYMIIVNSSEGCTEFDFFNFTSDGDGDPAVAQFEFAQAGSNVVFTNLSSAGTYAWDFGDNNNSNQASPTHDYDEPGTYNACLTVTSDCGSDQVCRDITVSVGSIVSLDIGETSGVPGTVVSVPVSISGADNLATLAGSFRVTPIGTATIVGVSAVMVSPQFNPDNLTFSYFAGGAGHDLNADESTVLFNLRVLINASSGQAEVFFSDNPVAIEFSSMMDGVPTVMATEHSSGMVSITSAPSSVDVSVNTNDTNGDPIEDVEYRMTSTSDGSVTNVMGDANGNYLFADMPEGGTYEFAAAKEDDATTGLSTFGLYIGQRYLLGLDAPQITSPYQIIAGDVNCSNSFTTIDLFLIQRLIVGDIEGFTGCPGWVFVHESSEMPADWNASNIFPFVETGSLTLTANDTTTSFVGVKKGDILGQANASGLQGDDAEGREATLLTLSGKLPAATAGQALVLELTSEEVADLASLQFQLNFDPAKVTYLGGELGEIATGGLLSERRAARGQLRLSWYSPDGSGLAEEAGRVLELRFEANTTITDWSEVFTISPTGFRAEAYRESQERLNPVLNIETEQLPSATSIAEFKVYQNRPNPFREQTAINFDLPQTSEVSLNVMDALGRKVLSRTQAYEAGSHTINLDLGHLESGLYYYQLQSGAEVVTLPMLLQQ